MIDAESKILVTNIQRFSLHDGPGIRTTIFFKGCSIHCPWCCNPENIAPEIQQCVHNGEIGVYGKYMTNGELYEEIVKDVPFYEGEIGDFNVGNGNELDRLPGGVTFSGGEALLQVHNFEPLLRQLSDDHIHMTVETSLFIDKKSLETALKYINLFYVDIKFAEHKKCQELLHGNWEQYLENLDILFQFRNRDGLLKPTVFRMPVIHGYTDTKENCECVKALICKYRPIKLELLKGHNLGGSKYTSLGVKVPHFEEVSEDVLSSIANEFMKTGVSVEICRI